MSHSASDETFQPLALAIDLGTSSVRSLLINSDGNTLDGSLSQRTYDLTTTADGGVEGDADAIVCLLNECIDDTLNSAQSSWGQIATVGMSCHWHNLLGLNAAGVPVTPVLHLGDNRSGSDVATMRQELDQQYYRSITGCMFHSSYWPAKLRWLNRVHPVPFADVASFTSVGDFAMRQWSGFDGMSTCMASGTGLLELQSGSWNADLLQYCQVGIGQMPRLIDRGEPVGRLTATYQERWPALAMIPWFPALGDGACANIGVAAIGPARMALTLGTTGAARIVVVSPIGTPITPPDGLWVYRLDQQYVVIGAAISNGGLVLSWAADLTGRGESELLEMAATMPAGADGLLMLPFLTGERSPLWDDESRGLLDGISLHHGPAHVARAGLESVALRLAAIYRLMLPCLQEPHLIVANGGALLKSPLWQQICADALCHDLFALSPEIESSARGAALLALHAAGLMEDPASLADPLTDASLVKANSDMAPVYDALGTRQQNAINARYPAD